MIGNNNVHLGVFEAVISYIPLHKIQMIKGKVRESDEKNDTIAKYIESGND